MKTLDINFLQFLILLGALQAIVFSVIIFFKRKYKNRANFLLALTVFFTATSILQHMFIDMDILTEGNVLRKLYVPIQWLILPMLYLHIKEFLYENSLKLENLIFLLGPFFIVLLIHLVHLVITIQTLGIKELPDHNELGLLLFTDLASFFFNGIVIYLIFGIIQKYLHNPKKKSGKVKRTILLYKQIISLSVICVLLGIISLVLIISLNIRASLIAYPFYIILSCLVYWVGYLGIAKNEFVPNKRVQKKFVGESKGLTLFNKINEFVVDEQEYLNPNISLELVAKKFEITSGYLSKLINLYTDTNFNDYVNKKRIEAAKKTIQNQHFEHYTLESIGIESGFKSKSSFYNAFKKHTNRTPNEYRKQKKMS